MIAPFRLERRQRIDSTNDEARRLAAAGGSLKTAAVGGLNTRLLGRGLVSRGTQSYN